MVPEVQNILPILINPLTGQEFTQATRNNT